MDSKKQEAFEKSYENKEGYITSRVSRDMLNIPKDDEKSYDFVDMAYDYLDSLAVDTLLSMSNKDALKGHIEFINSNYPKYETDEWGERINKD